MKERRPLVITVSIAWIIVAAATATRGLEASDQDSLHCTELPFVYNVFWTTKYGPAGADIETAKSNMLPCSGPSYALCYYSGPEPMPCKVDRERGVAICECYALEPRAEPYHYFVDINAILNTCAYIETVRDCGHDGSGCSSENSAPVCQYLGQEPQALMPGADVVSTFGLAELSKYGKPGSTECSGLYAGCMTAPCRTASNEDGETVAICECPLYDGPYQVGQDGAECDLGRGLVWSAAYSASGG